INKGHECNLLEKSMVTVWVPYDIQSSPSVTTADKLAEILCRCGKYFSSPRAMELYWTPRLSRCFTVMLAQLCFQVDAMGTSYPDEFKELRPNIVLRHVDCQRCVLRAFVKWVLGLTSSSVHNCRGCCKHRHSCWYIVIRGCGRSSRFLFVFCLFHLFPVLLVQLYRDLATLGSRQQCAVRGNAVWITQNHFLT